jgi:hypothetical protein
MSALSHLTGWQSSLYALPDLSLQRVHRARIDAHNCDRSKRGGATGRIAPGERS